MATEEQPKIKLYWLNQSRAQRIVWLLEELHLDYEVEIFHRNSSFLAPPELTKIHPLGKSPVVSITPPGSTEPVILAESGFITQYLCDHFAGKNGSSPGLQPARWKPGMEGKVGGETEGWKRFQYLLHYAEGSLMPYLLISLLLGRMKSPAVSFFIRPISAAIAGRISAAFVYPNARKHMEFLDSLLETVPEGGKYLCGPELSAADILLSFPLMAANDRFRDAGNWKGGSPDKEFPRVFEYVKRLEEAEGYRRACAKIEELEGKEKKTEKNKK